MRYLDLLLKAEKVKKVSFVESFQKYKADWKNYNTFLTSKLWKNLDEV